MIGKTKAYFSRLLVAIPETSKKRFNNKKDNIDIWLISIIFHERKDKKDQNLSKSEQEKKLKRQDLDKVN